MKVDEKSINEFLNGTGKLSNVKKIRKIDVPYSKNFGYVYTNEGDNVIMNTYDYKPFLFSKEIDFDKFFTVRYVEINENNINRDNNIITINNIFSNKKQKLNIDGVNVREIGKIPNKENKFCYGIKLHSYEERKKYFDLKIKEYNISYKKTESDDRKSERLINGYNHIFTINKPIINENSDFLTNIKFSSNPIYKYRNDGSIKHITGSYSNLIEFFKEGGYDPYKRNGTFISPKKLISLLENFNKKELINFYLLTKSYFQNKDGSFEIEDIFHIKLNEKSIFNCIKENYNDILKEYIVEKNVVYNENNFLLLKEIQDKLNFKICSNEHLDNINIRNNIDELYICHNKDKKNLCYNEINFLKNIKKIGVNIKSVKEFSNEDLKDLNEKINLDEYNKIIFDYNSFKECFTDKEINLFYKSILNYFKEKTFLKTKKSNPSPKKIFEYADLIGVNNFINLLEINDFKDLKIELNKEYIETLHYNKNGFDILRNEKGYALYDLLIHYNYDIFQKNNSYFITIPPTSQFMIQTGARIFKDMKYDDLKIMTLDIETRKNMNAVKPSALTPEGGEIFKIGIYCEGHVNAVLDADNNIEERNIIEETYKIIAEQCPDVLLTYNGEGFDFPFMEKRLEMLGGVSNDYFENKDTVVAHIKNIIKDNSSIINKSSNKLSYYHLYNRRNSTLKVGGSTEKYLQTNIMGVNVMDTMFQVKKASAINTAIPNLKLKDNIKFANIAKNNRVYVEGDKIGSIGSDLGTYLLNEKNGNYRLNKINIKFENQYFSEKIYENKNNEQYYLNENILFLYEENTKFDNIKNCINAYKINFEDNKNKIDKQINEIYKKIINYDNVIFPFKKFGENLTNYEYIKNQLINIINNTKNLKELYYNNNDDYILVNGKEIVKRYLIDDLWETKELDKKYSQSSFLLGNWMVNDYQKISTMGNASMWKLLMVSWFYHNNLTIPEYDKPRKINGGLIGLMKSGYCKNVVKIDASSLYPSVLLAYLNSPSWDVTGITNAFVKFMLDNRLKYKALKNEFKAKGDKDNAMLYDLLQLPLKILINSFYGFYGAYNVSPFADLISAHMITAISRQNARHLIRWFETKGYIAVYAHTDGVNFIFPDDIEEREYIGTGKNWLTKKDKLYKGIYADVAEYNDKFMPDLMGMDIDDILHSSINFAKSNFISLKAINKDEHKIAIVGGLIKKDTPIYIKEFIEKNAKILLKGNTKEYIKNYYNYINKIWNYEISAGNIASNQKLNKTIKDYKIEMKNRRAAYELMIKDNIRYDLGDRIYWINTGNKIDDSDFSVKKEKIGYMFLNDDYNIIENFINQNKYQQLFNYIKEKHSQENFIFSRIKSETGELTEKKYLLNSKNIIDVKLVKTKKKRKILIEDEKYEINKKGKIKTIKAKYETKLCDAVEIIIHMDEFNCEYLPLENHNKIGVKYNRAKYLTAFIKAVMPLKIAFNIDVREELVYNILTIVKNQNNIIKNNMYYDNLFSNTNYINDKLTNKEKIVLHNYLLCNNLMDGKYEELFGRKNLYFKNINFDNNKLNEIFYQKETDYFNKPLFNKNNLNLINGIPLKGKENNQQNIEDLLEISKIEKELWYDVKLSPNYPFDNKKIDKKEYYLKNGELFEEYTINYDCIITPNGAIDYLAKRPLVKLENMNIKY